MKLLDRLLLRSYFKSYAICFFSLVSLYVMIDLFTNLDEFTDGTRNTWGTVAAIGSFYFYRIVVIFDLLCGIIVLLAAMFTVAWMQRNNELLPLLSAGIPTRRVLRPIFVGTLTMLAASMANREFLMPSVAERLQNPAKDPRGEKAQVIHGGHEPNGILITGLNGFRDKQVVEGFSCTIPEKIAGSLFHVSAREAHYVPRGHGQYTGGWLLIDTNPHELPRDLPGWKEPVLVVIDPGKFFLYTQRVDYEWVTRNRTWFRFASTLDILKEMKKHPSSRQAAMAVQLHLRLTLPLLTIIMVLMGLALLLRDHSRNIFLSAGLCLVLAAVFFAACYVCRHLGEQEFLTPPLAAWLPVFVFGPLAFAMFDAIHT